MGSDKKEADIVVYNGDECLGPHILVECKKQDVSEAEFKQAIDQAYSYAFALPNNVKWVWVTSKIKNEFFQVDKRKNTRKSESDIPPYGVDNLTPYKFVKGADKLKCQAGEQKFFELQVVAEDELLKVSKLQELSKNHGFEYGRFDFIITNPPFGSAVKPSKFWPMPRPKWNE